MKSVTEQNYIYDNIIYTEPIPYYLSFRLSFTVLIAERGLASQKNFGDLCLQPNVNINMFSDLKLLIYFSCFLFII